MAAAGDWVPVTREEWGIYAFLRYDRRVRLLVVLNFDDKLIEMYGLTMVAGSLVAVPAVTVVGVRVINPSLFCYRRQGL